MTTTTNESAIFLIDQINAKIQILNDGKLSVKIFESNLDPSVLGVGAINYILTADATGYYINTNSKSSANVNINTISLEQKNQNKDQIGETRTIPFKIQKTLSNVPINNQEQSIMNANIITSVPRPSKTDFPKILAKIEYYNIILKDETNNLSVSLSDIHRQFQPFTPIKRSSTLNSNAVRKFKLAGTGIISGPTTSTANTANSEAVLENDGVLTITLKSKDVKKIVLNLVED